MFLVLALLSACAAHRVEMPEHPPSMSAATKRTFSIEGERWDVLRLHREIEAIARELKGNGFEELNVQSVLEPKSLSVCEQYSYHVSVKAEYVGHRDAGGHHYLTGFSLGLIPSWDSEHPHAEFIFTEMAKCNTTKTVRYVEHQKQLLWLPAAIVGFVIRNYREGECLSGQAAAMNFVNASKPSFEC